MTPSAPRDVSWYRLLLGWLEVGLRRTTADRLGLRSTPLKLLRFHDSPHDGHTTWSTYEFSDRRWKGPGVEVGYELAITLKGPVDGITALRRATEVLDGLARPPQVGTVLVDLFQGIDGVSLALRHGVIVAPWVWPDVAPLEDRGRRVELMMIVPAGEDEIDRAADDGFPALEDAWSAPGVNLLDPAREPLTD